MTFLRTEEGLTNQAMFMDVDIIVYTEGGEFSYSIEDVSSGVVNEFSIDQIFWDGILKKHCFKPRYELFPIGSKKTLEQIATLISVDRIQNVGVAMDSDYDELENTKIKSPYILYTHGYSWENDVFNLRIIEQYIKAYITRNVNISSVFDTLNSKIENYIEGCLLLNIFNLLYVNKDEKSIHYSKFESKSKFGKKLNVLEIRKFILSQVVKKEPYRTINWNAILSRDSQRYLPSKWVKNIYRDVLNDVAKKELHLKSKIPMDLLERDFIILYMKLEKIESYQHHEQQVRLLQQNVI